MSYLLSERPLQYLAGGKDKKGVVREPRPAVVRGNPQLTRQLINQLIAKKHRYVSGVLSFKELITPEQEQKIIDRFEATAFPGLGRSQFDCLWIRHSHNAPEGHKRSELHFLVPRIELSTGKALNIRPPGRRTDALYDTFRLLINHEFKLKDPHPAFSRLSSDQIKSLGEKLTRLTEARAKYNIERYGASPEPQELNPQLYEDRTGFADRGVTSPGGAAQEPFEGNRDALDRLGRATRALGAARSHVEHASRRLDPSVEAIREAAPQALAFFHRRAVSQAILGKYGVAPAATRSSAQRDQEMVLELDREP
jgi:hypothetical protein